MTAAMAAFAVSDAFIKTATASIGVMQCITLISLGNFLIFAPKVWQEGQRILSRDLFHKAVVVRTIGEVLGSWGVFMAISTIALSTATAMTQAQPLAMTLAAAVFLKEKVGWRRWAAVAAGLVGVMVIMRPGLAVFDPNMMWSVLAIVGLTMRDVGSRMLPKNISSSFALAWAVLVLAVFAAIMLLSGPGWQPMDTKATVMVLFATATVTIALVTITLALRSGEVSAVAPFRYTRIVFAMILAMVFFGERPDAMTWLGTAIIVGSGIYAFWRERRARASIQA
jgi:drug/metabolite transporter (DMT)-like permease